jgi:F-type H+-transporting ATPase subunit epsilon
MATLRLEIVTPQGPALRDDVDELTAPSVAGEFGVLPGHLPILAALKAGILTWKKKGELGSCAVGSGFIEVHDDRINVLTDRYRAQGDVDPVRVRADLKDIDEKIDHFPGPPQSAEFQALVDEELWCAALLELHGDPPPPTVNFAEAYGQAPDEAFQKEGDEQAPALTREGDEGH